METTHSFPQGLGTFHKCSPRRIMWDRPTVLSADHSRCGSRWLYENHTGRDCSFLWTVVHFRATPTKVVLKCSGRAPAGQPFVQSRIGVEKGLDVSKKANLCCSSCVRFQRRLHIRFHPRRPLLTAHLAEASASYRVSCNTNPNMHRTGPSTQASASHRLLPTPKDAVTSICTRFQKSISHNDFSRRVSALHTFRLLRSTFCRTFQGNIAYRLSCHRIGFL
jgi:hypothetical protein